MPDNTLTAGLRLAVQRARMRPTVLLVDDLDAGHSLVRHLALTGTPSLNLRVSTPATLAAAVAEAALAEACLAPASTVGTLLLVEDLLPGTGAGAGAGVGDVLGRYLARAPHTAGLTAALHSAVNELRLAGLTADDLSPDQFETRDKGLAIQALLRAFEAGLASAQVADLALLYRLALDSLASQGYRDDLRYLIPGNIQFRLGLEQRFVAALTGGKATVLQAAPPGLLVVSPELPVHLHHAVGIYNEVRVVVRHLAAGHLPDDAVELALTDYDGYVRAVRDICSGSGIPTTFGQGLPAVCSGPGRALTAFLTWIAEGFKAATIARSLGDGVLLIPGAGPGQGAALAAVLRKSTIGWGQARYSEVLSAMETDLHHRLQTAADLSDEKRHSLERRLAHVILLKNWFGDLLGQLAGAQGGERVALGDLCRAAQSLLRHCLPEAHQLDEAALATLTRFLTEAEQAGAGHYTPPEAARRLLDLAGSIKVNRSGPQPGHLHITNLAGAGWAARPHLWVLGLDEERFPGAHLQNPILLDLERARLSPSLMQSHQKLELMQGRLRGLLSGHRGDLGCSYSTYDSVTGRAGFPSAALLEIARQKAGDPTVDYRGLQTILGAPTGYVAPTGALSLDRLNWWLSRLVRP